MVVTSADNRKQTLVRRSRSEEMQISKQLVLVVMIDGKAVS
jgi:hypothetical protein